MQTVIVHKPLVGLRAVVAWAVEQAERARNFHLVIPAPPDAKMQETLLRYIYGLDADEDLRLTPDRNRGFSIPAFYVGKSTLGRPSLLISCYETRAAYNLPPGTISLYGLITQDRFRRGNYEYGLVLKHSEDVHDQVERCLKYAETHELRKTALRESPHVITSDQPADPNRRIHFLHYEGRLS